MDFNVKNLWDAKSSDYPHSSLDHLLVTCHDPSDPGENIRLH